MIQSHLYVKRSKSPVYLSPVAAGHPASFLERGNWVGVIETLGDWVKIVCGHCIGWIEASELESRPPFDLHIHQVNPYTIEYVNSAG